ncbi:hypothetical protein B0H11DRAFT_2283839 [Mycena galericulata]|nr:hypothetical protein B0H11DRAFT_2283839 [Mycena galericulata]
MRGGIGDYKRPSPPFAPVPNCETTPRAYTLFPHSYRTPLSRPVRHPQKRIPPSSTLYHMDSFISLSALAADSTDAFDGTAIYSSIEQQSGSEEMPLVDSDTKSTGYYPTYCVVA